MTNSERSSTRDMAKTERPPEAEPSAENIALFDPDEASGFRTRWEAIQTGFVDEPRAAVEQADALVGEVTARLADSFDRGRRELERQWDTEGKASTEDLRVSLKRYRSFFERLLSL